MFPGNKGERLAKEFTGTQEPMQTDKKAHRRDKEQRKSKQTNAHARKQQK
jgi:hypothetical protein